jgi:pimeloyl-ACP methyl ester carboxylesterase
MGAAAAAFLVVLQLASSSVHAQDAGLGGFSFSRGLFNRQQGLGLTTEDAEGRAADFDWLGTEPSEELVYHDCYTGYKCARLLVPLNYADENDGRTVPIAILKIPAAVPEDDPTFKGSLLFNPGGPGHAGTSSALGGAGPLLQNYFDVPGEQRYEIIAFDSRGLGWSTPIGNCFEGSNELARQTTPWETRPLFADRGSRLNTAYFKAIFEGEAQRCAAVAEGNPDHIFNFMTSAAVASDMVRIIDAIKDLRDETLPPNATIRAEGGDVARLNYAGFSYGTLLGNYFASMFPGRVGRLLLDSVEEIHDYVSVPGWTTDIKDMDATFVEFLKGCYEAGTTACPMRSADDADWTDMEARFWAMIAHLDAEPVGTLAPNGYTVTIRGADFLSFVGAALYDPLSTYKVLASVIARGFQGNYASVVGLSIASGYTPQLDAFCPGNVTSLGTAIGTDSLKGYACGDAEDESDKDLDYWDEYVQGINATSQVWGVDWSIIRLGCTGWPFRPEFRFTGPFTTPEPNINPTEGVPLAPILLINNEFDPVAPADSARATAEDHPGARVVVVKGGMGHLVISGMPSNCTRNIVNEYMLTGKVPDEETECDYDCGPLDETPCVNPWLPAAGASVEGRGEEDIEAQAAGLGRLSRRIHDFPLGGVI